MCHNLLLINELISKYKVFLVHILCISTLSMGSFWQHIFRITYTLDMRSVKWYIFHKANKSCKRASWHVYPFGTYILGLAFKMLVIFKENHIIFLFHISHEMLRMTYYFVLNYMGLITFNIFQMSKYYSACQG